MITTPHRPHAINPFYATRGRRKVTAPRGHSDGERHDYARLPRAPKNGSPIPHLTSLYHFHHAGEYGDRSYPGNCGGNLIKDLLKFYQPGLVYDPLCGAPHKGSSVAESVMWRLSSERRFHGGSMESVAT